MHFYRQIIRFYFSKIRLFPVNRKIVQILNNKKGESSPFLFYPSALKIWSRISSTLPMPFTLTYLGEEASPEVDQLE